MLFLNTHLQIHAIAMAKIQQLLPHEAQNNAYSLTIMPLFVKNKSNLPIQVQKKGI